jgi:FixJ family two-component response regulator
VSEAAGSRTETRGRSERILLVDDDVGVVHSVKAVLRDEGFDVIAVNAGRDAVSAIERWSPALVLLDVWMPDLDGIEVLERIRAKRKDLPVVVVSGHGTVELAVRATRLGAVDFIEKPFSIDGLLSSVRRALGRARSEGSEPARASARETQAKGVRRSGPTVPRRTLADSVVSGGLGLHSGVRTGLILHPSSPGSGIRFGRVGSEAYVEAAVENVDSTGYATTLYKNGMVARTVEHLLAALHAYGITDLLVKVEGEAHRVSRGRRARQAAGRVHCRS